MSNGFTQYLKDTRAELRHVAWPTRVQTIVYTILVIAISIGVALYLGFFDFVFTTSLTRALFFLPHASTPAVAASSTSPITITQQPVSPTSTSNRLPATSH